MMQSQRAEPVVFLLWSSPSAPQPGGNNQSSPSLCKQGAEAIQSGALPPEIQITSCENRPTPLSRATDTHAAEVTSILFI